MGKLEEYDSLMKECMAENALGPVPENPTGELVHYVAHHSERKREKAGPPKLGLSVTVQLSLT